MAPEDLDKLVSMPMPFGKHKGTVIADLPGNYLAWFAREGFPGGAQRLPTSRVTAECSGVPCATYLCQPSNDVDDIVAAAHLDH